MINDACTAQPTTFDPAHRVFDVPRGIDVDPASLHWPTAKEATMDGFGGNRFYLNMRGFGWHRARRFLHLDQVIVTRYERAAHGSRRDAEILAASWDWYSEMQLGLDPGTASTVAALAAAGGIPISSCNGGAFGDRHSEPVPAVAFYWKTSRLDALLASARAAGMSVWTRRGALVVSADRLPRFLEFAAAIERAREQFPAMRSRRAQTLKRTTKDERELPNHAQLEMFPDEG